MKMRPVKRDGELWRICPEEEAEAYAQELPGGGVLIHVRGILPPKPGTSNIYKSMPDSFNYELAGDVVKIPQGTECDD